MNGWMLRWKKQEAFRTGVWSFAAASRVVCVYMSVCACLGVCLPALDRQVRERSPMSAVAVRKAASLWSCVHILL